MKYQYFEDFKEYIYLASEINALYHEAALQAGLSDSVMNILYTVLVFGDECTQSNICKLTGISRQTINSAIRKMEQEDILYLEDADNKRRRIRLTERGQELAEEKVMPVMDAEHAVFDCWSEQERQEFLRLTRKYLKDFKEKLRSAAGR